MQNNLACGKRSLATISPWDFFPNLICYTLVYIKSASITVVYIVYRVSSNVISKEKSIRERKRKRKEVACADCNNNIRNIQNSNVGGGWGIACAVCEKWKIEFQKYRWLQGKKCFSPWNRAKPHSTMRREREKLRYIYTYIQWHFCWWLCVEAAQSDPQRLIKTYGFCTL